MRAFFVTGLLAFSLAATPAMVWAGHHAREEQCRELRRVLGVKTLDYMGSDGGRYAVQCRRKGTNGRMCSLEPSCSIRS